MRDRAPEGGWTAIAWSEQGVERRLKPHEVKVALGETGGVPFMFLLPLATLAGH